MSTQIAQQYANRIIGSDTEPYEVIRSITEKTLEIRRMDATLDSTWKPEFHVGGFCAHCSNQSTQRWTYASNGTYAIIRVRLNVNGQWKDSNGSHYYLSESPRKFHDYNY